MEKTTHLRCDIREKKTHREQNNNLHSHLPPTLPKKRKTRLPALLTRAEKAIIIIIIAALITAAPTKTKRLSRAPHNSLLHACADTHFPRIHREERRPPAHTCELRKSWVGCRNAQPRDTTSEPLLSS